MADTEEPTACTVTPQQAESHSLAWAQLKNCARAIEPLNGGAVMVFPKELADHVEQLAAQESSCCSFLAIATHRNGDEIRLEMTASDPDGVAAIVAMVGLARR